MESGGSRRARGERVEPVSPSFGELLRGHRLEANLTQEALAARSGLSVDAISMLERGVRRAPRRSTVVLLAGALRLSPSAREALIRSAQQAAQPLQRSTVDIPRELPRPIADFTGRSHELAILLDMLDAGGTARTRPSRPVVISAIDGMGGVGKSALAIHAANQLADLARFPDGQLYIDLQGSTVGLAALEPLEALGRMLRSLGMSPAAIPATTEEAAARFRTLTADRRVLVLLDNASSAAQVRPLLPGSPTCAVLVTSRRPLTTLEGAGTVHLDVLPPDHALALLTRIAGDERAAADPHAAAEVVRLCGRLPLAIRIAGARLAARPAWPMQQLVEDLVDAAHRLETLEAGDLAVRTVFDVSLRALHESADRVDVAAAAAFDLLSLPDGPDIGVVAAARLLDEPVPATRALLERLVEARLLETSRPERFAFHDLVRLYARQHAGRRCSEDERRAALGRLLGFYAATAWRTLALLRPGTGRLANIDPEWATGGLELRDVSAALEWLEAERVNLSTAIAQAATDITSAASAELPVQLAQALFGFYDVRAYWLEWARANEIAVEVTRRTGNLTSQARSLADLGTAYSSMGRHREGIACQEEALAIFRQVRDRRGEALALGNLGVRYSLFGRHDEAIACLHASIAMFKDLGDQLGSAHGLINLGRIYEELGRYNEAIDCQRQGLAGCRELDHRQGMAAGLNNLGEIYGRLGRHHEAILSLQEGLTLFRELGDRYGQAASLRALGVACGRLGRQGQSIAYLLDSLTQFREIGARGEQVAVLSDLGDALRDAGRIDDAVMHWQEALTISEVEQFQEANSIRARLATLPSGAAEATGDLH